jgi:hypothetical protein
VASTLSYCMNVHPGEGLEELLATLRGPAHRVREEWRPQGRMGAGLWLPAATAQAIAHDPSAAARVREALAEAGLFAFSVNAFPFGGFHAAEVKSRVYRPTWAEPERLAYTEDACRALAALLEEGGRGSVSTVPVGYKAFGAVHSTSQAAGAALGRLTSSLEDLEAETGRSLAVALEPEPLAVLETVDETIAFLEQHVFRGPGAQALAEAGGPGGEAGEAALRRRVGVCVDTCHLACEFEDLSAGVGRLRSAGVVVVKAQLSSALELRHPASNAAGLARLLAFAEPRYLHQTLGLRGGQRVSFEDLTALTNPEGELVDRAAACEVLRTHFHVPLCWEGDEHLGTTRSDLLSGLSALAGATDHLEVETYTFEVLPAAVRARYGDDVVQMVAAELAWTEAALRARGFELG